MMNAFKLRDKTPAAPDRTEPREELKNADTVEGNVLFEALVCEFHWTALQIGGVTCIVNAAQQKDRAWILRSCQNLIPAEAALVGIALKLWSDLSIPPALARFLSRIYVDLADAKRLTAPIIEASGSFGGAKITPARLQQLEEVWRQLTKDCLEAVHDLEPHTRWRLTGHYSENAMVLAKFLKEVISNKNTLVDHFGNVSLPALPQRRREPRYALLQPCMVYARNNVYPGFARDVSQNGLGISCKGELRLRENVTIELRGGRRLRGRIVWNKNGQQGLQFETPLDYGDPLISLG